MGLGFRGLGWGLGFRDLRIRFEGFIDVREHFARADGALPDHLGHRFLFLVEVDFFLPSLPELIGRALEFRQPLSDRLPQFGKFPGAEYNECKNENDDNFLHSKRAHESPAFLGTLL